MKRALAILLLCTGCGGSDDDPPGGADAADPISFDAAGEQECTTPNATFGRCLVEGTGEYCTGQAGEISTFAPIADGDALPAVTGPQGAQMFVLALRTSGIFPGDGSAENPRVWLFLYQGDTQISSYMSLPTFMEDAGGDTVTAQDLYLVLAGPSEPLVGQILDATADITDRDGVRRCGRTSFEVAASP